MAINSIATYASRGNGRYLATSAAIHGVLLAALTALVIEEEINPAKPLPMSVSVMLVDAAERCPVLAQKEPEPTFYPKRSQPTQRAEWTPIQKIQPISKTEPIKSVEPIQKTDASISTPPVASSSPQVYSRTVAPVQPVAASKVQALPKAAEAPITAAIFNAAYLNNPKPHYPKISKRLGEEGTVLLKVRVLADGTAGSVAILKSSEFDRLDQSAIEAVKNWKFVAAKQEDKPIDSWVSVPIAFKLDS